MGNSLFHKPGSRSQPELTPRPIPCRAINISGGSAPIRGQPGHFSARGNHGHYIYVVPEQRLVMVRFGKAFGYGSGDAWPRIFEQIAAKAAVEANVEIKEDVRMTSGSFNPGAVVRRDEQNENY